MTFDHGIEGSLTEDSFFALTAWSKGYSFGWIDGEMHEQSPFTIEDMIRQRKRWLQGILMTICSKKIQIRFKIILAIGTFYFYNPFNILNVLICYCCPIHNLLFDKISAMMTGFMIYSAIYGMLKSLSINRLGFSKFICCVIGSVLCLPMLILVHTLVPLMLIFKFDRKFYVVKKDKM